MKKVVAMLLTCAMVFSLTACGGNEDQKVNTDEPNVETDVDEETDPAGEAEVETPREATSLDVVTTFAGNDGGAETYQKYVDAYQAETGDTINDASGTADEAFKARVLADFEVGAEPDVLFYFNGVDSNAFVSAGKVVSIDTIRAEYPEYASNMKDGMIPASPADGVKYAIPSHGYWEGMFVNKTVCEAAGVEIPGANTTWDEFLETCQKIKDAGYTPIAAALANVPHYWFEFVIYNQLTPDTHCTLPTEVSDTYGQAWVNGIADIKDLYEKGFFPDNTLSALDDETFQMFIDGKAAFLIDGSWKANGITSAATNIEDFTVTFVPGKNNRKATDMIGGLSSGWYITKKAWDDPTRRAAAVDFVTYMTSDVVVSEFAQVAVTALTNGAQVDEASLNSLQKDCITYCAGATGIAPAVQDLVSQPCRVPLFDDMPKIVTGDVEIADQVQACLDLIAEEAAANAAAE